MFSIKVVLQDEVRRVQVSQDCGNEGSYLKLQETVRNMFPALQTSQFSLIWQDDEGDKVTASSDGELRDALQVMSYGEGIPRFTVKVVEEKASESPETPVIHFGITCDECGVSPIQGNRFKCTVRHDFDLCESCQSRQVQPYPMTKNTTSQFPAAGGCPRFGGRFGGRGGCHGSGGFHGFGFGGPHHGPPGHGGIHGPPPPPHGGPHGRGHGGRGGRGGWGGPRHGPRWGAGLFGGCEPHPFPEAEGTYSEPNSEGQGFQTRRGPVQTPWGPADIVHAYLDGKDILSNLMGAMGVSGKQETSPAAASETTGSAAPTATTAPTEVPTAQPMGRTFAEVLAEARSHARHHGHGHGGLHEKRRCEGRGRGRGGFRHHHHQREEEQPQEAEVTTRDLNDEDEALQTAIRESWEESPKPASVDEEEDEESAAEDGVIVIAPEAVAVSVEEETAPFSAAVEPAAPVTPAAPTHNELCAVWNRELTLLASMGFVDTAVLVPLLQTHLVTPGAVSEGAASPTAGHMEGMQRVVAELLAMMGVMF